MICIEDHYWGIEGRYEQAVEMYSEAIFCKVPPKKLAIYYCNRAFVNIKCENYAIALFGILYLMSSNNGTF